MKTGGIITVPLGIYDSLTSILHIYLELRALSSCLVILCKLYSMLKFA